MRKIEVNGIKVFAWAQQQILKRIILIQFIFTGGYHNNQNTIFMLNKCVFCVKYSLLEYKDKMYVCINTVCWNSKIKCVFCVKHSLLEYKGKMCVLYKHSLLEYKTKCVFCVKHSMLECKNKMSVLYKHSLLE